MTTFAIHITMRLELGQQAPGQIHEQVLRHECRCTSVRAGCARLEAESWRPGDRVTLEVHGHELRLIKIVRATAQIGQPPCAVAESPVWFFGLFALLDSGWGQLEFHIDSAGEVVHDRTTYSLRVGDQATEDAVAAFTAARGAHPDDHIVQDGQRLQIQRSAAPETMLLSRTA